MAGVIPEVEAYLQSQDSGDSESDQARQDTLLSAYNQAIWNGVPGAETLRFKKAWIMIRDQRRYSGELQIFMSELISDIPDEVPEEFYTVYVELVLEPYKYQNKKDPLDAGNAWQLLAVAFTKRRLTGSFGGQATAELEKKSRKAFVEALPGINHVRHSIDQQEQLNGLTNPEATSSLFALVHLYDTLEADFAKGLNRKVFYENPGTPGFIYTWAAVSKLEHRQFKEALELINNSLERESDTLFRAYDLLLRAEIQMKLGAFEASMASARESHELCGWGDPFLFLAELMIHAGATCHLPAFDKKAIYWAAIDQCMEAGRVDSKLEQEVAQRIYRYSALCPNSEEIRFRGLRHGDTYAIDCRIEILTTVKEF